MLSQHASLTRSVDPTADPVLRSEIKHHLRVDASNIDDDGYIDSLTAAATAQLEHDADISIMAQTWQLRLDTFPSGNEVIKLDRPPVTSVTSVTYYDGDDVSQTLAASNYSVDTSTSPGRIKLTLNNTWPTTRSQRPAAVLVTFVAGFSTVPTAAAHAIKILVSHWYEHRESVVFGQTLHVVQAYWGLVDQMRWRSPVA